MTDFVCESGACDDIRSLETLGLSTAVYEVSLRWCWDDHDPVSRSTFDTIESALIRTVGEPTLVQDGEDVLENIHVRHGGAIEFGKFAAEHDIPIVDPHDDAVYADLVGDPKDGGYVPVLVCLERDPYDLLHGLYHSLEDRVESEDPRIIPDGGERADDETLRTDIERYIDNHPNADRWKVLAELGLGPDHQDLVDDVLDDTPDTGDEIPDDAGDDYNGIDHTKTCANPHCTEPRLNPHPDSLCERHYPGDPSVANGQTNFDGLENDEAADDVDGRDQDLLDEAEAVAGEEPIRPDDGVSPDEGQFEAKPDAQTPDETSEDTEPDAEPTAAAFMGGDDSPFASDEEPEPLNTSSTEAEYARTVSALPLNQLDALNPAERRRAARKRGLDWPSTDEARDELWDTIATVMAEEDDRIVDAPTSLGKSYTVASTRWGARDDLTGGKPVIHLSQTRDARDEAIEAAEADGGEFFVLKSRDEACPVAAGDYDPDPEEDDDQLTLTIDGQPASEWIHDMCDGRGLPFSAVHRHLEEHNDQCERLPCCESSSTTYDEDEGDFDDGYPAECPAIYQWERWRDGEWPLTIATHNFAHVPGVRNNTNLVIDEEPSFKADLSSDRIRRAVSAFLTEVDAPMETWEAFIQSSRYDGYGDDAANERAALEDSLNREPDREWYFRNPDAHTLAPALARAIFHAEDRPNGRRVGKTPYEPPRLDAQARDDDGWNREWVSVVLDDSNNVKTVRTVPDLGQARSVIGLDAHPARPVWQANTLPWIQPVDVLDTQDRQLWRRYERGLRVVQVGDATRPLASGEYFDDRGTRAVVEHLQEEYGSSFRTALTANSVEDRLQKMMRSAGCHDPETMHFGEEKSRNDFATEKIGLVNGCIDPGDDYVVDLLAELDLDAEPERSETECDHCDGDGCPQCDGTGRKRAHGRGFTGNDAEAAAEILAAVRENHTAQAAGRYARSPEDPDTTATVFVRTDAVPAGFIDVQVPGAEWVYTTKQQNIVEALRDHNGAATVYELTQDVEASKRTVQRVLKRLVENDAVHALESTGPNGATLYRDSGTPNTGVVDLTDEDGEITTTPVWGSYTWAVAIDNVDVDEQASSASSSASDTPDGGLYQWVGPPDTA